jgi:hypothetical protein
MMIQVPSEHHNHCTILEWAVEHLTDDNISSKLHMLYFLCLFCSFWWCSQVLAQWLIFKGFFRTSYDCPVFWLLYTNVTVFFIELFLDQQL